MTNSYSSGFVSSTVATQGGLIGANIGGTVNSSYWDLTTSNQLLSAGGVGMTTPNMRMQANFVGWDFTNIWAIQEGVSYPTLQACLAPAIFTAVPAPIIPTGGTPAIATVPVLPVLFPQLAGLDLSVLGGITMPPIQVAEVIPVEEAPQLSGFTETPVVVPPPVYVPPPMPRKPDRN